MAQERQVNVEAQFVNSNGIGDKSGGGFKIELVLPANDFFTAVAESSVLSEPKGYVGSNIGIRTRLDARFHPIGEKYRPFVSVGYSNTYQHNADYSKSINGITYGAGINIANILVPYWRHYRLGNDFFQTNIRADEFTVPLYFKLDEKFRWRIKASVSYVRSAFTQTAGTGKGDYTQRSILGGLGVGYTF